MARSPVRSFLRLFAALLTVLSLGALTAGPTAAESRTFAAHTVLMVNFQFVPQTVTVRAGDTVTWVNNSGSTHTTTSDSPGWNFSVASGQASPPVSFPTPGTFRYHCIPHAGSGMTGTVTVTP
ncbi:cupredoxin domain-containing protein [Streptomyces roseifaciens]|uniref:cupredoxin domain-containing protein n=1 Tax=Streptomyces roseifaciens TaxID=1488406 RepID=UPI00099F63DF|nr:plastocyanin/azurin family copper-binding protein [Streptomyces roseifaciens]